jgi:hypothetical protein
MIRKDLTSIRRLQTLPAGEDTTGQAVENELRWQERAQSAIRQLADRGVPFTSEDIVRAVGRPPSASLLPALIRAAHRRGLIAKSREPTAGSVWVGAAPVERPTRFGRGRRSEDAEPALELDDDLLEAARRRAAQEAVPPKDVLTRALRAYLAGPRSKR